MSLLKGLLGGGPVQGGLLSPNMALASALLQASGPSRMPVSMGQALGAGIDAYGRAQAAQNAQEMQNRLFGLQERQFGLQERKAGLDAQQLEAEAARQAQLQQILALPEPQRSDALVRGGFLEEAKKIKDATTADIKSLGGGYIVKDGEITYDPALAAALMAKARAGATNVTVGGDMKLPPGYMWADPSNPRAGVQPIPGGEKDPSAQLAVQLPEMRAKASALVEQLKALKTHPGRKSGTGLTSVFPSIPGGDAFDFDVRLQQVQGQAFLEAFQALKGAGAITEREGQRAEQARARLNAAQSESAFLSALDDYIAVVQGALNRMEKQAGQAPSPPAGFVVD